MKALVIKEITNTDRATISITKLLKDNGADMLIEVPATNWPTKHFTIYSFTREHIPAVPKECSHIKIYSESMAVVYPEGDQTISSILEKVFPGIEIRVQEGVPQHDWL